MGRTLRRGALGRFGRDGARFDGRDLGIDERDRVYASSAGWTKRPLNSAASRRTSAILRSGLRSRTRAWGGAPTRFRRSAALEALERKQWVDPNFIAIAYAAIGDKDRTMEWLETSFRKKTFEPAVVHELGLSLVQQRQGRSAVHGAQATRARHDVHVVELSVATAVILREPVILSAAKDLPSLSGN